MPLHYSHGVKINNNNENNAYTIKQFLMFFVHWKYEKILSKTCRMFNENYRHLPSMTRGKFRRIKANFVLFGRIDDPLIRQKRKRHFHVYIQVLFGTNL